MKTKFLPALLLLALAPLARATTMDQLDHTSLTLSSGNATYSNFTYGGVTPSNTVTVTASTVGSTSVLTFARTGGPWTVDPNPLNNGSSIINYHVDFTTPVTSIGLDFDGAASGGAVASVAETITNSITHVTYPNMQVTAGVGPTVSSASFTFPAPVTSLDIIKSIDIAGSGTATISTVHNTFSVPEPASLSLLALAALPLLRRRRGA